MPISLLELKLGDMASIESLGGEVGALERQRLFACGFIPGVLLSVVGIAPFGNLIQVRLPGGITLSIGRQFGRDVWVRRA